MENKQETIRKIWSRVFDDSPEYVDWFFNNVYREDEGLVLERDTVAVSSMLLQQKQMSFHGEIVPISYVCGAATLPSARNKGYMSELMHRALKESLNRDDVFCTLIPANERLFGFYQRYGFSATFDVSIEHYSSAHVFSHDMSAYTPADDPGIEERYAFFDMMMKRRPCCILHSEEDFRHILSDNAFDSGFVSTLKDRDGSIVAMAFAIPKDGECLVKELLYTDTDSRNAVLQSLHDKYGNTPMTLMTCPDSSNPHNICSRGMARIVNAGKALSIIARVAPSLHCTLHLHDDIIEENNRVFHIKDGRCSSLVGNINAPHVPDYDIDMESLCSILFGNAETASLLDFPSQRPFLSLMLD